MKKRIITVLFIALLIVSMTACNINDTESNISNSSSETSKQDMTDEEREAVEKLLEDNGIDKSILDKSDETDLGGKVLGGAQPVKQFRTLRDGEEYYKSYFGFHNTIESIPEYSLVGFYCINDKFMWGIYQTEDEEDTVTVKYSITLSSEELREPYKVEEFKEQLEIGENTIVKLEGESKDKINLITTDTPNNKHYAVYSVSGLEFEKAENIAKELITNLESMEDWK